MIALPLAAATRECGGKAIGIRRLIEAGCVVPPGCCLEAETVRALAAGQGKSASSLLTDAVIKFTSYDGQAATFAVRSSAFDEDQATSSAAGRYRSIVGVRPGKPLEDAVRLVYSSAGDKDPSGRTMGIVIQRYIPGLISGVMFTSTIEPRFDRSVALVEACSGGCAGITDGTTTPERLLLSKFDGKTQRITTTELSSVASDSLGRRLCVLARDIEAWFGAPQDVEWTVSSESGILFVLQSRPITQITF